MPTHSKHKTNNTIGHRLQVLRRKHGFTQEELARKGAVNYTTLTKIESGVIKTPSIEIIAKLAKVLEVYLEDLADLLPALDLKQSVTIYKGKRCIKKLLDDVYKTLKESGGEVYVNNVDERKFLTEDKKAIEDHIKRLAPKGISEKLLAREGDTTFFKGSQSEYRWMPKNFFTPTPFYVYGDKIAMVVWGKPVQGIVIKNSALAEAYRKQFLFMWERAKVPKK